MFIKTAPVADIEGMENKLLSDPSRYTHCHNLDLSSLCCPCCSSSPSSFIFGNVPRVIICHRRICEIVANCLKFDTEVWRWSRCGGGDDNEIEPRNSIHGEEMHVDFKRLLSSPTTKTSSFFFLSSGYRHANYCLYWNSTDLRLLVARHWRVAGEE